MSDAILLFTEPNCRLRFILGPAWKRARLYRGLKDAKVGEPLLYTGRDLFQGLSFEAPVVGGLLTRAREANVLESFWWSLLGVGLVCSSMATNELTEGLTSLERLFSGLDVRGHAKASGGRTFLIDGVEAFLEEDHKVVEALLSVHSAIENDPVLRGG